MISALRRGACPTIEAPLTTGDGLLARLNPVAGSLAPAALAGIATAAKRHGNGLVEVTSRGSLQVRGLTAQSAPGFAGAIAKLAIPIDTGVPVATGPLAGLDGNEIADPTAIAGRLRHAIAAAGLAARLGPKVSVVLDGGGELHLGELYADIRLEAIVGDGDPRWLISVGGNAERAMVLGSAAPDAASAVALGLLEAIADKGADARGRDLATTGIAKLALPLTPPADTARIPAAGNRPMPIGTFSLADGRVARGIGLPFGQVEADRLIAFCEAAAGLDIAELRLAPGRAILSLCSTEQYAAALAASAENLGFVTRPDDPRLSIAACTGAPGCASGHLAARRIAAEIAASEKLLAARDTPLHVSGCAKQCARPANAAITLVGTAAGCEVHCGAGDGSPVARVANGDAAAAFRRVAWLYETEKMSDENFAAWRDRVGVERLAAAFRQGR